MTIEEHEKWEPVEGITTPVARAEVKEDREGLAVTLVFSEIVDGLLPISSKLWPRSCLQCL